MKPILDHWRLSLSACLTLAASIWYGVTWADDKLKKIERIPAIEAAVIELKTSTQLMRQRDDLLAGELLRQNQTVVAKLDELLHQRGAAP